MLAPQSRQQLPSWRDVLTSLAQAWVDQRDERKYVPLATIPLARYLIGKRLVEIALALATRPSILLLDGDLVNAEAEARRQTAGERAGVAGAALARDAFPRAHRACGRRGGARSPTRARPGGVQ